MGIRAICFLPIKNISDDSVVDIPQYLNKFREGLFKLGAFGFDTWECTFDRFVSNAQNGAELPEIILINFNDANEVIVGFNENKILVADSCFPNILPQVGLNKPIPVFRVDGAMAQLGDFKIRYGTMYQSKEKPDRQFGFLFDIEYLPVNKLTTNYKPLFSSFLDLLIEKTELPPQLFLVPEEQGEFSFKHLGYLYSQIKEFAS